MNEPMNDLRKEEKTHGMLCHVLAFCGYVIPLGNILGPLIMWLLKKDESEYVDYHGKESLNFQISILIYVLIAGLSCLLLIGFVLLPAVLIFDIVAVIIATVKANDGIRYRYPLCIRLIK